MNAPEKIEPTFARLSKISVKDHVEKKGQFAYLSWPFAVSALRMECPAATWEVKRFNGLPYLQTELGFFVEVGVTVDGVELTQIHPVLDGKNKPIQKPTTFDINTSIQRCLVKAIALHGLGLSIYAGEDLVNVDQKKEEETDPYLDPAYIEYEKETLPNLEVAANNGIDALNVAFKGLEANAFRKMLRFRHGENLKAIAEKVAA